MTKAEAIRAVAEFSQGNLKYVPPNSDNEFLEWYRKEFGCEPPANSTVVASYRSAWEHGRLFERSIK